MAAYDFSSLLQFVELAHRRLQQENHRLLEENNRLNDVLSGKLRSNWVNDKSHAEGSCTRDRDASAEKRTVALDGPPAYGERSTCGKSREEAEQQANKQEAEETTHWYKGSWIDLTGEFFFGSNIFIGEHTWEPMPVKGSRKLPKDSTYSMVVDEDGRYITLQEHRATGQKRLFRAEPGPADSSTMIVWLQSDAHIGRPSNPSLIWTLTSNLKGNTLGKRQVTAEELLKEVERAGRVVAEGDQIIRCGACHLKLAWIKAWMCLVIICNLASFGTALHFSLPGYSASDQVKNILLILDIFAFVMFVLEIGAAICIRGWRRHYEWLSLNIIVTTVDMISGIICLVENQRSLLLRSVVLLRIVRLFRIAKFFHHLSTWKVAWQLAYGLMSSASTVISMFALLLLILYAFACIGLEVITKNEDLLAMHPDIIEESFGGIFSTMITLFQFVTVDGVNDVYAPLIKAEPLLLLYFVPIVLLVSISLMNMVTGVIVEGAMKRASDDRHEERHRRLRKVQEEAPVLKAVFARIAKEDDSVISQEEFEILNPKDYPLIETCLHDFHIRSMSELFDMLDESCRGEITEQTFVAGMLSLMMAGIRQEPPQLVSIHKLGRTAALKSRVIEKAIYEMHARQCQLYNAVAQLQKTCDAFMPSANRDMLVHTQHVCHSAVDDLLQLASLSASSASKPNHKISTCAVDQENQKLNSLLGNRTLRENKELADPDQALRPLWCTNSHHPPSLRPVMTVVKQELPRAAQHQPLTPPLLRSAAIEASEIGRHERLLELEGECSWRDLDTESSLTATTARLPNQADSGSDPLSEGDVVSTGFGFDGSRFRLDFTSDCNLHHTCSYRPEDCAAVAVKDVERLQEHAHHGSGPFECGTRAGDAECAEYGGKCNKLAEYTKHDCAGAGSTTEQGITRTVCGIDGSHVRLEFTTDCDLHSRDPKDHAEGCVNVAVGQGFVDVTVENGEELGFAIQWCSNQLPLVDQVLPGSASDLSGVLQGDRIVQCNGISVADKCRNEIRLLLKKRPLLLRMQRNYVSG